MMNKTEPYHCLKIHFSINKSFGNLCCLLKVNIIWKLEEKEENGKTKNCFYTTLREKQSNKHPSTADWNTN